MSSGGDKEVAVRGNQTQMRNRVQELVIITLLLWATQTLVNQLAHGAPAAERFVPPAGGFFASTVEIRPDAVVIGHEVKLRQIARWGGADAHALEQTGELVVARFENGQDTLRIDLEKLRATLEEAGVNLGAVNFTGAMACKVARRDVAPADADAALEQTEPKLLGNVSVPEANVRSMDQARQTTLKDRVLA